MIEAVTVGPEILVPALLSAYAIGQGLNYLETKKELIEKYNSGRELPEYEISNLGRYLARERINKDLGV